MPPDSNGSCEALRFLRLCTPAFLDLSKSFSVTTKVGEAPLLPERMVLPPLEIARTVLLFEPLKSAVSHTD